MSSRTLAIIFVAMACLMINSGCGEPEDYGHPGCNVILISIDTLRSDRLGCYGHTGDLTPQIDRFREDAVLFRRMIAHAPSTMPSHASIFTSLIPSHHGAFFSRPNPLPESCITMAELLKTEGYRTVSFNDGGQLAAELGFDQGFDTYVCMPREVHNIHKFSKPVNAAFRWFHESGQQPFFLFLHTYHTHHPYTPNKRFLDERITSYKGPLPREINVQLLRDINKEKISITREDGAYILSLYEAEIEEMDHIFGRMVNRLKKNGIYDNSLIIFTSDHGEEMGEHGSWGWHSHSLFEELLRVPLIIKFPDNKFAGTLVEEQARSLDILPTILDVIDSPPPEILEGKSLLPLIQGRSEEPRPAVAQIDRANKPTCLRVDGWKFYPPRDNGSHKYRGALYRIDTDPWETRNKIYQEAKTLSELSRQLDELLSQRPDSQEQDTLELSTDLTDQLRQLGYLEE